MINKKTKQEGDSFSINEAEFKEVLKKIFQTPSQKKPVKKKTRPKPR